LSQKTKRNNNIYGHKTIYHSEVYKEKLEEPDYLPRRIVKWL
jgi:hypothetical protein